jgi:hypothetical protein
LVCSGRLVGWPAFEANGIPGATMPRSKIRHKSA